MKKATKQHVDKALDKAIDEYRGTFEKLGDEKKEKIMRMKKEKKQH